MSILPCIDRWLIIILIKNWNNSNPVKSKKKGILYSRFLLEAHEAIWNIEEYMEEYMEFEKT